MVTGDLCTLDYFSNNQLFLTRIQIWMVKVILWILVLQVNTLKLALEGVEKERDYYFSKLREVELLCQEQGEENAPFVDRLMEVLYASDEQVSDPRLI